MTDVLSASAEPDEVPSVDPAKLERALRRLPFLDREAFLLKTRDRLAYAEIGVVLGLSSEAAEARVVAALIKLDVRLQRQSRPWWRFWR